jgi:hypothetical protein
MSEFMGAVMAMRSKLDDAELREERREAQRRASVMMAATKRAQKV